MSRKKLPIGIQTFSVIRDPDEQYIYVDKTKIANKLLDQGKYFFLSRPRRFGKSLFLDTLAEIFKGNKHLFQGLFIYDQWNWEKSYPVMKIDLSTGDFSTDASTKERISHILNTQCRRLGVEMNNPPKDLGSYFELVIESLYNIDKKPVVILVDEYDKPILDNIRNDTVLAASAWEILKAFYAAIKSSDSFIKFVFITGVSKFSKLNLFSGLNNLEDITIDENYAEITGYTQTDLHKHFADYLQGIDLEQLKSWYNGYNYFGEPVYNPFDILLFFSKQGKFRNYWWETGNPSFLIDVLKSKPRFIPELENIVLNEEALGAFDVEIIDLAALLWQTGYLTFDKKITILNRTSYQLKVPNLEVQYSLNTLFFEFLTDLNGDAALRQNSVSNSLLAGDLSAFEAQLRSLFAGIPYNNYVKNNLAKFEGYYASVVYAFLASLGFQIRAEDTTNRGRIDMTLIGPESIFILEFKVDMPPEKTIDSIKSKKYHEKYTGQGKEVYLVGIAFDSTKRNILSFEHEML